MIFSDIIAEHVCAIAGDHGKLEQSDAIMQRTFFIGVYPGLSDEAIDYMVEKVRTAVGGISA